MKKKLWDARSDATALGLNLKSHLRAFERKRNTEELKRAPRLGLVIRMDRRRYLHHQHDSVEGDQCHDGVFERRRHHKLPHLVLEGQLVLWHVSGQGPGVDGKVNAGPLVKTKSKININI